MSEAMAIARLLDALDALGFIARHLHPPRIEELVATLGDRDAALRKALADAVWPDQLRDQIESAAAATLRACDGLRAAVGPTGELRQAYRALRAGEPGTGGAVSAGVSAADGKPLFPRIGRWDRRCWPGCRPDRRAPACMHAANETRRARRFLGVCAGGLRPGTCLSAGDGAAWRLRARAAVPVELAARGARPRGDPGVRRRRSATRGR